MMTRTLCCALLLTAAFSLPAAAQVNQNPWKPSSAVWGAMNKCAQAAFKQFPDYTPEGNARREAARQKCLRDSNLPNEVDAATPPPAPASPAKQAQ
jgi:hypothetical protein